MASIADGHVTLNPHLLFVTVDAGGPSRPVPERIVPRDAAEAELVEAARARREQRPDLRPRRPRRAG